MKELEKCVTYERRKKPNNTSVLYYIAGILTFGVIATFYLVSMIHFWVHVNQPKLPNERLKDTRPDISHCFEESNEQALWDCINHKGGSTDV